MPIVIGDVHVIDYEWSETIIAYIVVEYVLPKIVYQWCVRGYERSIGVMHDANFKVRLLITNTVVFSVWLFFFYKTCDAFVENYDNCRVYSSFRTDQNLKSKYLYLH